MANSTHTKANKVTIAMGRIALKISVKSMRAQINA
jgi:hypothetical protein